MQQFFLFLILILPCLVLGVWYIWLGWQHFTLCHRVDGHITIPTVVDFTNHLLSENPELTLRVQQAGGNQIAACLDRYLIMAAQDNIEYPTISTTRSDWPAGETGWTCTATTIQDMKLGVTDTEVSKWREMVGEYYKAEGYNMEDAMKMKTHVEELRLSLTAK